MVIGATEADRASLDLPEELTPRHCQLDEQAPPPEKIMEAPLVLVFVELAELNTEQRRRIALLRDYCKGSIICARPLPEDGSRRSSMDTEMRALGFRVEDKPLSGLSEWRCYAFNIRDYKPTPDWLNPRAWANPELWDKYRW